MAGRRGGELFPTVVVGAKDDRGNDLLGVGVLGGRASAHWRRPRPGDDRARSGAARLPRSSTRPTRPMELKVVLGRASTIGSIFLATFAAPAPAPVAARAPPIPAAPPAPEQLAVRRTHTSGWAYVLGAVGLAGIGSFAYLGATGLDEKNQLRASCGNTLLRRASRAAQGPLHRRGLVAGGRLWSRQRIATWPDLHPQAEEAAAGGRGGEDRAVEWGPWRMRGDDWGRGGVPSAADSESS